MKTCAVLVLAAASMSTCSIASAHHSTSMFEWGNVKELKDAKVVRWEWTNPHTFLYVTVTGENREPVRWAFEGMSPNHLARAGWSKATLKPGDTIDLTYYPLRDKRNGGFNVAVTLPDGKQLNQLSPR